MLLADNMLRAMVGKATGRTSWQLYQTMTYSDSERRGFTSVNYESLLDDDHLLAHLYRWRDFSGSHDDPKAWVMSVAADPKLFPKLMTRFLSVGTQSSWGDRVSTKSESFRRDTMTDFFDLQALGRQVAAVDPKRIDPEEARILGILKWHLERWESGHSTGY